MVLSDDQPMGFTVGAPDIANKISYSALASYSSYSRLCILKKQSTYIGSA